MESNRPDITASSISGAKPDDVAIPKPECVCACVCACACVCVCVCVCVCFEAGGSGRDVVSDREATSWKQSVLHKGEHDKLVDSDLPATQSPLS